MNESVVLIYRILLGASFVAELSNLCQIYVEFTLKTTISAIFYFYLDMVPLHITKDLEGGAFNQENK
jgi:hypothetical protein